MVLSHTPGETVERSHGHRSQLIKSNDTIVDLIADNRSLEQSLAEAHEGRREAVDGRKESNDSRERIYKMTKAGRQSDLDELGVVP